MSLQVLKAHLGDFGFPRVSGDEPSEPLSWAPLIQFSPRERG